MVILNICNVFGLLVLVFVVNNVVVIVILVVYLVVFGEFLVDLVWMGNVKLLVFGIGIIVGVFV